MEKLGHFVQTNLRDIFPLRLPIGIGSESAPGLVAVGEIGERYQHRRLVLQDRANAMPGEKLRRRQRTFVAAYFEYGAGVSRGVSVEDCRVRQVLGGECGEQQPLLCLVNCLVKGLAARKWLRDESCSTNDTEKCSTFQVTVRLPLF